MVHNVSDSDGWVSDKHDYTYPMNIPVNIFLEQVDDLDDHDNAPEGCEVGWWRLHAENFIPRKSEIRLNCFEVYAPTRKELEDVITKHVLPLYRAAVEVLEGMVAGTEDGLYYWEKSKPEDKKDKP